MIDTSGIEREALADRDREVLALRQRIKELEDELDQLRLLVYTPSEENDDE